MKRLSVKFEGVIITRDIVRETEADAIECAKDCIEEYSSWEGDFVVVEVEDYE